MRGGGGCRGSFFADETHTPRSLSSSSNIQLHLSILGKFFLNGFFMTIGVEGRCSASLFLAVRDVSVMLDGADGSTDGGGGGRTVALSC